MSNFIKLHGNDGTESYVNMDKVYEVCEGNGETILSSDQYNFHVKETPEEIVHMLREESKK